MSIVFLSFACKASSLDNPCDPSSKSFAGTLWIKVLLNSNQISCGIYGRSTNTSNLGSALTIPTKIYGQLDFTSNSQGLSATKFFQPYGTALDTLGGLYVADGFNKRVLYFPQESLTALRVYGEPDFTTNSGGLTASLVQTISSIATDWIDGLYVTDYDNNRVLYFPSGSTTASRVYGQADFTSSIGGTTNSSMFETTGVLVDPNNNLYVSDSVSNTRILFFPSGFTTASSVYGQSDFTSAGSGTSNIKLNGPGHLALDSTGGLYVADIDNNRVIFFPTDSTTATRVYGQSNFSTNTSGIGASSLNQPSGVSVDLSDGLYISDSGNNRILYYAKGEIIPTQVYGQADYNSNTSGLSQIKLDFPRGISSDSQGGLYVSDSLNNRVLYYPPGPVQ